MLVLLVDSLVAPHFWQVVLQVGVCSVALSTFLTVPPPLRYGDWYDAGDRHWRD